MKEHFLKKAGIYGRMMKVWKELAFCEKCNDEGICLATDLSDFEYSTLFLCFDCIRELEEKELRRDDERS